MNILKFQLLLAAIMAGICLSTGSAAASTPDCTSRPGLQGTIKTIERDLTIILTDETRLKLASIIMKDEQAVKKLSRSLPGKSITYYAMAEKTDHLNRLRAQIMVSENGTPLWLQAELLKKGAALAFVNEATKPCFQLLRAKEQPARRGKRGLWGRQKNKVFLRADDLGTLNKTHQGEFIIVRGKVLKIGHSGLNSFLNFGNNWRKDFTIVIEKRLLRRKSLAWPDLQKLEGQQIEVRGWLDHWGGPMIRLEVPEMLRLVTKTADDTALKNPVNGVENPPPQ